MKAQTFTKDYRILRYRNFFFLLLFLSPTLFAVEGDTVFTEIYEFKSAPVIDGVIEEEWSINPFHKIEKIYEELSVESVFSEEDFLPRFKMGWYENRLYFLFECHDDILFNENEYAYEIDGYSINLDLGYEMNYPLDSNDHNLVMGWGKPESCFIWSGSEEIGQANIMDLIDYAEIIDEENGLYIAEISFDVSELNMPAPLAEDMVFGMDIEVYDYDGNFNAATNDRDMTAFWFIAEQSWNDRRQVAPVGTGSIRLKSAPTGLKTNPASESLSLFPLPATGQVHLQSDIPLTRIDIRTTAGVLVYSVRTDSTDLVIDISSLAPGYYLLSAGTRSGLYLTKKLLVK